MWLLRRTNSQRQTCKRQVKKKGKVQKWNEVRAVIKTYFEKAGITYCEMRSSVCNMALGDGFAHTKKRRFCNEDELWIVAYLCNNCHNTIEGKPDMEERILSIRKRTPIPEIDEYIKRQYQ